MKLSEWLNTIDANLLVTYYANQNGRWCAHIEHGETKDGIMLTSEHGNGPYCDMAVRNYFQQISGKRLVIYANSKEFRREYVVPTNLEMDL